MRCLLLPIIDKANAAVSLTCKTVYDFVTTQATEAVREKVTAHGWQVVSSRVLCQKSVTCRGWRVMTKSSR